MYNIPRGDIMSNSVLRNSAKEFAKKIVFVCRDMKADRKEAVLVNQLLRSATSIGANIHEAQYAQSTNDFNLNWRLHKKNVMKQSIGWNCFSKLTVWKKKYINHCKTIVAQYAGC